MSASPGGRTAHRYPLSSQICAEVEHLSQLTLAASACTASPLPGCRSAGAFLSVTGAIPPQEGATAELRRRPFRVRRLTMEIRVSSKGQVVLPSRVRRKLGIVAGHSLDVRIDRGRVVLAAKPSRVRKAKLGTSRRTGLPVIETSTGADNITSEMVKHLLDELP